MRYLTALVLAALTTAPSAAQEAPAPSEPTPGAIRGLIVDASTQEPLGKAEVTIYGRQSGVRNVKSGRTDGEGLFELIDVEPGRYRLQVRRNGYAQAAYGQRTPGQPGAELSVSPGQLIDDVVVSLQPAGVITGRVVDEDGEPMSGMQVQAMQYSYRQGKRELQNRRSASTDDRGIYRVHGIPPGDYYLQVTQRDQRYWIGFGSSLGRQGYLATFYPGVTDASQAALVQAAPSGETMGIDFHLQPTATLQVSGRVVDAEVGGPISRGVGLFVLDREAPRFAGGGVRTMVMDPKGRFQVGGLRPGSYRAVAQSMLRDRSLIGQLEFELTENDVEDLTVMMHPLRKLAGRVVIEGEVEEASRARINLSLRPDTPQPFGGSGSAVRKDGSLLFDRVTPGRQKIRLGGGAQGLYLKRVQFDGRDALTEGLDVPQSGEMPELVVTLSANAAQVEGQVTTEAGSPLAGVRVVLVPDDRDEERLFKTAVTDQNGIYSLAGIAPGRYKLFAWEQIDNGAWLDPNVLGQVETKGERVEFEEGDTLEVDLDLIEEDQ